MAHSQWTIPFIYCLLIRISIAVTFYISQTGRDFPNCGLNVSLPCGTLYYTSTLLRNITEHVDADAIIEIIIDGQNETEIESYLDNTSNYPIYNPCLPIPLLFRTNNPISDMHVSFNIRFNTNIMFMDDWYPNICRSLNQSQMINTHMLYIIATPNTRVEMIIYNLRINDIDFGLSNGLMAILWTNIDFVSAEYPKFSNIRCYSGSNSWNYELSSFWYSRGRTLLYLSEFENITLIDSIVPFIFSSTTLSIQGSNMWRFLTVSGTNFCSANSINADSLYLDASIVESGYVLFHGIELIGISNSYFDIYGAIITTDDDATASFRASIVVTSQIDDGMNAIFSVSDMTLSGVDIKYYYSLYENCVANGPYQNQYATVIKMNCINPKKLLYIKKEDSAHNTIIENIRLSLLYTNDTGDVINLDEYRLYIAKQYNFTMEEINNQSVVIPFQFHSYNETHNYSLITVKIVESSYGEFNFQNMEFNEHLFGSTVIDINSMREDGIVYPDQILLDNISVINSDENSLNPNDLISNNFFRTRGSITTVITIQNCNIFGLKHEILQIEWFYYKGYVPGSILSIFNTTMHHSLSAIKATLRQLQIRSSTFHSLGNYYTDITYYDNQSYASSSTTPIYAELDDDSWFFRGDITNSIFSYYSVDGILRLRDACYFNFSDSTFDANLNQLYWYRNIPSNMGFQTNVTGIIAMDYEAFDDSPNIGCEVGSFVTLLRNRFEMNEIDLDISYLSIICNEWRPERKTDICMSGNIFHNYALYVFNAWIASCFRPHLAWWTEIDGGSTCSDINYGMSRFDLMNLQNRFIITRDISVLNLNNTVFAMDNIIFDVMVPMMINPVIYFVNSSVRIIESVIDDKTGYGQTGLFGYDQSNMIFYCHQYYNDMSHQIAQIWIVSRNISIVNHSVDIEYINYLSPISIELEGIMNNTYFPGGQFMMKYTLFDKYYNIVPRSAFDTRMVLLMKNAEIFVSESIIMSPDPEIDCELCDKGIYFPNIIMENVNRTYELSITNDRYGSFLTSNITIEIINCKLGYGVTSSGNQCERCADGYFSIGDGNRKCQSCDKDNNERAITCIDGDKITVKQYYWIGFQYDNNSTKIISALAPFGRGCILNQGCDYIQNTSSLCAENRDPFSIMCSKCIDGYSELFLSNACGKCNKTYYLWLIFPFSIAVIVVFVVLIWKSTKKNDEHYGSDGECLDNCNCCTNCTAAISHYLNKNEYILNMMQIMLSNCILYYQQSISQIFSNSDININLAEFSAVFNLSIDDISSSSESENGFCFINGMTAKDEILSGFILIAMIFGILCIIHVVYTISRKYCCSITIEIFDRTPNFGKTFVAIVLLTLGQVLSILFKLSSCQNVGDQLVHFYFGYQECFDYIWWFALIGLMLICVGFIIFSLILFKMDDIQRQHDQNILRPLTLAYKPQFYYWEFVILFRRILIAFLSISFGNDNVYPKFGLITFLFIFVHLQSIYQPFIIHEANNLEFSLLICIIMVIIIDIVNNEFDEMLVYIILSVLIIFPFMAIFWLMWKYHSKAKSKKIENNGKYIVAWDSNDIIDDDLEDKVESSVNAIPLTTMLLNRNNHSRYDSLSSNQ